MHQLKTLIYGILAGVCISIGGTVFLSLDSKIAGALFFTVGLFVIVTQGYNLFTGKVCYVFEKDGRYALDLIWIWLGNLIGCFLFGSLILCTRASSLTEKAAELVSVKLNDGLWSIFLLSVCCNILIFFAVDGFNRNPHELGKYLSLFFGVTVFILCGFEHCVANMFYITAAKAWSLKALGYVVVMSLGNAVGGVIFPLLRKFYQHSRESAVR